MLCLFLLSLPLSPSLCLLLPACLRREGGRVRKRREREREKDLLIVHDLFVLNKGHIESLVRVLLEMLQAAL